MKTRLKTGEGRGRRRTSVRSSLGRRGGRGRAGVCSTFHKWQMSCNRRQDVENEDWCVFRRFRLKHEDSWIGLKKIQFSPVLCIKEVQLQQNETGDNL